MDEAPVKAPRTWPKSVDSSSVSGTLAQFSLTKARCAARAVGVDGAGDELLAGAALADDEDGDVAAGDAVDEAQQLAHRLAAAGDLVVADSAFSRAVAGELELGARDVELRSRARCSDASRRARARSARRAARRRRTASRASAMAMAACEATTRTHASSRGPKAPLRTRSSR